MRKTTGISFEGDRTEVLALGQLADEMGVSIGKLVADAIREKYGEELKPLVTYFRKRASQKSQSTSEKVKEVEHA